MAKWVESVKLLQELVKMPKGLEIPLDHITLLVGDQGAGKTTLLTHIAKGADNGYVQCKKNVEKPISVHHYDTEKDNPRIQAGLMNGDDEMMFQIGSMFASHGESLIQLMIKNLLMPKASLVLIDEPEAALSVRSIHKIIDALEFGNNEFYNQYVIATHNVTLIEHIGEVYSLEHQKKMTASEYLSDQLMYEKVNYLAALEKARAEQENNNKTE